MAHYRSTGIVLLTDLGDGIMRAILQKRGEYDFEKMRPESWPGGTQVTVNGGIDESEEPLQALIREVSEELGRTFVPHIHDLIDSGNLKELIRYDDGQGFFRIFYGGVIDKKCLKDLALAPATGGLIFITKEEIPTLKNIRDFDRTKGISDRTTHALFPEDIEAVKKAFDVI
jgi:8-oxo-dGTP pyrophosphatase MutT (NUDIX family)